MPLFGIVSRLTPQKGFDLLIDTLPRLLQNHDVRLAVVGSGDAKYEEFFAGLAERNRGRAMFFAGYDEALAHWIEGASDIFLMPSQYEPCGLNQMYSLRYGTIPIVRRTGGLADSVQHFDPATGTGTGIVFNDFDARRHELGARYRDAVVRRRAALGAPRAERHAPGFLLGDADQRVPEAVRRTTSA